MGNVEQLQTLFVQIAGSHSEYCVPGKQGIFGGSAKETETTRLSPLTDRYCQSAGVLRRLQLCDCTNRRSR